MDYIYDLALQMGKQEVLLDRRPLQGERAYKLYQYLKKTKNTTPAGEAAVLGCTEGGSVHRKTIRHLECVLVNNLTALRPGEMTSGKLADTRKYVWKLIAIGRRQVYQPNSKLVIPFLKEAFHLAEDNGLIMAAKVSSELLANLLGHRYLDEKNYAFYWMKAELYREINLEVQRSILCFQEVLLLQNSGQEEGILIEIIRHRLESLKVFEEKTWHPKLNLIVFQLKIKLSEIEGNPSGMITHASESLTFLDNHPQLDREYRVVFLTCLGYAYLLINDFKKGSTLINGLMEKIDPLSFNYGKISEIKLLLCFRTGNYEEALQGFVRFEQWLVENGRELDFLQSNSLFSSYLLLLITLGVIECQEVDVKRLRVKLELLRQSTDLVDLNHLNVISLMKNIAKRRYRKGRQDWRSLLSSRREMGNRYKCFYALLSTVFEQDLHRRAVERHAVNILKRLNSYPLSGESILNLQEIIPYEELWQMILSKLKNKRIKLR